MTGDATAGGDRGVPDESRASETRLRIAAHNGAPEFGGAEKATAILLRGLADRGHDVVLFCNRDVVAEGVGAYGVEVRRGRLGGDVALHDAVRFALQLRRWKADVLLVGTFRKLWLAALAGRLAGVPVVARIGLSTDVPRNLKYAWVIRRWVAAVVTNAERIADAYRESLPDAPPPRIETIHAGIEPPDRVADPGETRRSLGVPSDAPLVGGVGRLVVQKRFDRFLRTVALLPPEVHALVVGGGPLRSELGELATVLGVAERVHFTGYRDDVLDVMATLDLLLVASDREGLANVMIEAMFVGTPVVSTPVSGADDALRPLEAGSGSGSRPGIVADADPERLADSVASLLADGARRGKMGAAARAAAEKRFGKGRMLDAWESVLGGVSRRPTRSRAGARTPPAPDSRAGRG